MANRYQKGSHFSGRKFRLILKLFSEDINATSVSNITNLSRPAINRIFLNIRMQIASYCEYSSVFETGEIEIDESYFGARRVKGIRGRGAKGKTIVFGMLKRGDKVYTQVVRNCSVSELLPIIEDKINKDSVVYTDCWKSYDGLVDYGYKQHYRVKHSVNQFADGKNHINGIENFWGICKVRLAKFRGINDNTFYLHLKECEFRYNYRKENIYKLLLKIMKNKNK
jgi:transposase